jgi:Tfp pilus assembly protein PilO
MASPAAEKRKTSIIIILSVLAIIVGLAMIYLQATNLNSLKTAVEDEKLALAQAEALLNQRLEYQANAPFYREEAARLKQLVPEQPQEEEILRLINLTAEEYDLRIHEIRFENRVPNAESGYITMPLVITVEGSYRSLIELLDHLQWSGRAFRVDQVRIALSGSPQGNIRTVITANVFYRAN